MEKESTGPAERGILSSSHSNSSHSNPIARRLSTTARVVVGGQNTNDNHEGVVVVKEENKPSWPQTVAAGTVQALAASMKQFGLTGMAIQRMLTKQAFLMIGQRSSLHASTRSSIVIDPHHRHHYHYHEIEGFDARRMPTWTGRFAELIKGSLLGMTTFGVYDYLILRQMQRDPRGPSPDNDTVLTKFDRHTNEPCRVKISVCPPEVLLLQPMLVHLFAGALAGMCQSVVLDGWEIGSYWWHRRVYRKAHQGVVAPPHLSHMVNLPLVFRRLHHHSLGYMTLFGTYEYLRRNLMQLAQNTLESNEPWTDPLWTHIMERFKTNDGYYDVTNLPLLVSFTAGGFSGQAHFVVSHYLRQIRKRSLHPEQSMGWKHPSLRAILLTFGPTALSFTAFQYGSELTERWLLE